MGKGRGGKLKKVGRASGMERYMRRGGKGRRENNGEKKGRER